MEPILMQPSGHSPTIEFFPDGKLKMEGRAIPENVVSLFDPLIEFATKLETPVVIFNVNLEYFNTASSKKLAQLFKTLDNNKKIGKVVVTWHYEEGDEDSFETAEIYESTLKRAEFRYNEYPEVSYVA